MSHIREASLKIILFGLFLVLIPLPAMSGEKNKVIFQGVPYKQVVVKNDGTQEQALNEEQKVMWAGKIVLKGDKLIWITRKKLAGGHPEMLMFQSGAYILFVAPEFGYVKVSILENEYIEHVHFGLGTITYWGKVEKLVGSK